MTNIKKEIWANFLENWEPISYFLNREEFVGM